MPQRGRAGAGCKERCKPVTREGGWVVGCCSEVAVGGGGAAYGGVRSAGKRRTRVVSISSPHCYSWSASAIVTPPAGSGLFPASALVCARLARGTRLLRAYGSMRYSPYPRVAPRPYCPPPPPLVGPTHPQEMGFSVYGGDDAPYVWVGFPGRWPPPKRAVLPGQAWMISLRAGGEQQEARKGGGQGRSVLGCGCACGRTACGLQPPSPDRDYVALLLPRRPPAAPAPAPPPRTVATQASPAGTCLPRSWSAATS